MMDTTDKVFEVLVRTVRAKRPELLKAPFTVSELYQQILPFRHYRRELELETNQAYEHALMELLAGAGASQGYLDVDERLRDQLRRELAQPSPDPARVREFGDAHISINPAAEARVSKTTADAARPPRTSGVIRTPTQTSGPKCRYCSGALPEGRELNFCPHCGQNLQVLNCPGCGGEIETGWKYCVSCGKTVPESLREE